MGRDLLDDFEVLLIRETFKRIGQVMRLHILCEYAIIEEIKIRKEWKTWLWHSF